MTTDSSSKITRPNTINYQGILASLDQIDVWISTFLFRLSLPPIVEAIYSVPANFFGLVPSLAICPLWIAVLALEDGVGVGELPRGVQQQHSKIILLKSVTVLLTIVFLVAWALFQKGYNAAFKNLLVKKSYYLFSILFNVGLLSYTVLQLPSDDPYAASSKKAFSLATYLLFLWPPSLLLIIISKRWFQRVRPVVLDLTSGDSHHWLKNKTFPNISYYLASKHQAKESFPSGDATSAAIFAIVLVNISPRYITAAWSILFLACTGRMYVLAHHFFDVLTGSMIAFAIYRFTTSIGLGIYDMQWWYPLASTMSLTVYVYKSRMENKQKLI